MTKPDGGSAFPSLSERVRVGVDEYALISAGGMTLRDYFAAAALTGYVASLADPDHRRRADKNGEGPREIAIVMYLMADAMLAERSK